jgi:hypothetical protein
VRRGNSDPTTYRGLRPLTARRARDCDSLAALHVRAVYGIFTDALLGSLRPGGGENTEREDTAAYASSDGIAALLVESRSHRGVECAMGKVAELAECRRLNAAARCCAAAQQAPPLWPEGSQMAVGLKARPKRLMGSFTRSTSASNVVIVIRMFQDALILSLELLNGVRRKKHTNSHSSKSTILTQSRSLIKSQWNSRRRAELCDKGQG